MWVFVVLAALADEPPKKVEETILVTATRSERGISELPVSATVVREEEIRSAPVRSVDDLVRTIPGVHMAIVSSSGSTPNNQRVSMRGLGGNRALVLLDGIPIHDPYSGVVQWQKVPLDSLRQVEVVRGGGASLFGNFALGGTINLITRPVEQNGVTADLAYGTGNTGRATLTVDRVLTPRVALRVSHTRNDSNGFVRVPDPGPVDLDAWIDSQQTSGRADFTLSERAGAFFKASTAQVDISQGTAVTYSKRDLFETSAGTHLAAGASGLVSASAFYQKQSERLTNSTIVGQRVSEFLTQDGTNPSTGAGATVEWSMQRRGVIPFVSVGVDARQAAASENRTSFGRSGAVTQRSIVHGRQRFVGLYAQASWQPSDRLEVLASTRLDTFRNDEGSTTVIGGAVTDYPAKTSKQLDPRVSIRYAVSGRTALRASAYRAFNAPTLRDLYRNNQTGNSIILGNPALEPETLVGGEIGWEWAADRGHVEVNVYRNIIDGLQSRGNVPGQPANVFQQMNLGKSRSQGAELMADMRIARRFSMNAGYTLADSVVIEDPDPALIGNRVPEVARHTASLGLRYRGAAGTNVDLRGRVVSRSYGEASNLALSPAHRVVDLSVSQPVRPWLDVYGVVENVLDEHYYLALAPTSFRSGLPRTVTGGVRINLGARKQP